MTDILILLQIVLVGLMIYLIVTNNRVQKGRKVVIDREGTKDLQSLNKMRNIKLTTPLTEESRPETFDDIVGQESGIKGLMAALCSNNPQHVLIYGPPGVGKTAAARLVLEKAKELEQSPFRKTSKFVEIDATTIRFDERGIADPLIGSVHDPIYQGAGAYGVAGIPQPKPGAVTKAHGGILFLDEIGELHPIELNKLLKVLEDRKVFLDSSYYNAEDPNMPKYIKEVFENGLPADFRLVGATTRSPEEILPAIRSRCIEIFFDDLSKEDIIKIGEKAAIKKGISLNEKCKELIGDFCRNGREVINLIQLSLGIATNEKREEIKEEDIQWVVENCQYIKRIESRIPDEAAVGKVNGLAVYGSNVGALLTIEATTNRTNLKKTHTKVTGVIEEESISSSNRNLKRKSMILSSVDNGLTVLKNEFHMDVENYNVHINFPGGGMVDGPSAGISITTAIFSSISGIKVSNEIAMTGEITILGEVKPIGGVKAKILAAKKAGAKKVIIPKDNYNKSLLEINNIEICPVENIKEVLKIALVSPFVGEDGEFIGLFKTKEETNNQSIV